MFNENVHVKENGVVDHARTLQVRGKCYPPRGRPLRYGGTQIQLMSQH